MKSGCEGKATGKKRSISLPVLKNSKNNTELIRKSLTSRWRAGALITLNVLMVAHFIQWRLMGTTVSPIEPSESMFTLQNGAVNAGVIFFSLAIIATLIFGRFVCGWGCHILALQDLCAWILKKIGLTPRPFRSRLLVFVPLIVALYMFVWPTVARALTKPKDASLFPAFTNHIVTTDFWATFPPLWIAVPFLFICGYMTVYFLGSKGFCTYACPYGGFFGLADQIAPGKIRVTDACNQCGHCTATCTSNVIVHQEVKQYGMVVDPGCMKCMDCISVCPNDALYWGFGKPSVAVKKTLSRNYSLTWPEEILAAIVFAASYFAVWDVYQLVPMLMALGIASVTTFVVLKAIKLFKIADLSFYRFNLKAAGKVKPTGWVFVFTVLVWVALVAHSGWIRYHETAGSRAFQRLQIPDELALAQVDPARWLSAVDVASIGDGRRHLKAANDFGFFANADTLPKLAWFEFLAGNAETAGEILKTASDLQGSQPKALSLYYRGSILNRLGRYDEAFVSLDSAIAERPDLVTAFEEKGESQWQLGRTDEAESTWLKAIEQKPNLPLANSFLAGAAMQKGDMVSAAGFEDQAARFSPNDPLFHWMLGLRLKNLGMNELANEHFNRAIAMNPEFRLALN